MAREMAALSRKPKKVGVLPAGYLASPMTREDSNFHAPMMSKLEFYAISDPQLGHLIAALGIVVLQFGHFFVFDFRIARNIIIPKMAPSGGLNRPTGIIKTPRIQPPTMHKNK